MARKRVGSKISDELPPGRRRLAELLRTLYEHLGQPTLAACARHLEHRGFKTNPGVISRYVNGDRLPPEGFITHLHAAAVEQAGSEEAVGITREEALAARAAAESWRCKTCPELRRTNHGLQHEVRELRRTKAGLERRLIAAQERVAHLPVPSSQGDRQQRASGVAAATQIAAMAEMLKERGDVEAALAMVLESAEVLSPPESAASLALLRQKRHDELADTLIQIYGRDKPEKLVIRAALELYEYGMADDAGAMLRAAAD
ncbi:hypothetical protein [Streptomyces sp. OE57]|uniref:hypothetical protein n=1 Tax=Streptomyces lacaronensis TaxID=3379885 RepID=UPI0039B75AC9